MGENNRGFVGRTEAKSVLVRTSQDVLIGGQLMPELLNLIQLVGGQLSTATGYDIIF
jgi:hypothetical protein